MRLHNKKITLFAVYDKKENPTKFITLTLYKKEADEFIYNLLRISHFEHFKSWCEIRNLDVNDDSSWSKYLCNCLSIEDINRYVIHKVIYKLGDVVSIMRMFGGCIPIGCSFDTECEQNRLDYILECNRVYQEKMKEKEEKNGK